VKAPDASRTLDAWRNERAFPVLTRPQIQQLGAGGRRRAVTRGEVLLDVGDKTVPLFVVVSDGRFTCPDGPKDLQFADDSQN